MKNYAKRYLSLAICGILGTGILSGCNSGSGNNEASKSSATDNAVTNVANSDSATGDTSGMSPAGEFPIVKEKKTFNVMLPQVSYMLDASTNEFAKWYEDKTNIHINFEQVPEAALKEKVNLALASNTLPDAFLSCGISATTQVTYGTQGVFIPLNNMIDKYGVEIKKAYENSPVLPGAITTPDGNIYALADINECYHCSYYGKAWINQTWLDNLGLKYPETTDDLYTVLKAFKEQDANGNGDLNDEIPMLGSDKGWGSRPYDFLLNSFIYNNYGTRLALKDGKITFVGNTDEFKEGLIYIKKLLDEGLIDPVSLTQTSEQGATIAGNPSVITTGVVIGATLGILGSDTSDPLKRSKQYIGLSPLKGPKGVRNVVTDETNLGQGKFVITNKCEDPEILFRWADGMFSDEATLLSQMGPEGIGYEKPAAGMLGINEKPALYKRIKQTDASKVQNHQMENIALANRNSDFRLGEAVDSNDPEAQWSVETRLYRETKERFAPYRSDETVPPLILGVDDANERASLETQIIDYTIESMVGFLAGSKDINKDWDKYVKEFDNLNLSKYLELLQKGYDNQYGNK